MTDHPAPGHRALRAAFFGLQPDDYEIHAKGLRANPANAAALRDEAAREYEYVHRALESLDTKATACIAAALALVAIGASVGGPSLMRWLAAMFSGAAAIFSTTVIAPDRVRLPSTENLAAQYGQVEPSRFLLQIATQYSDAVAAARLPLKVKAIRLRISLVFLFASAVCLTWR